MNMHSTLSEARVHDLHETAARHRASREARAAARPHAVASALATRDRVVVRRATPQDGAALARLAELDSAPRPQGEMLLVELDDRIVAAVPVAGGRSIGDPFVATADLIAFAERRAAHLQARAVQHRGRVSTLRDALPHSRRAA